MSVEFAYSLNGEHFRGTFASREEALSEGLAAARRCDDSPQMVYVARRVGGDAMASGHARAIVSHMVSRAREEFGDAASGYLAGVPKAQVQELDNGIAKAIGAWLDANHLSPTFFTYEAISQHPVSYGFVGETISSV
jgi:hypothetical protein